MSRRVILALELKKLEARLAEKSIGISLDDSAMDFLISKGWDEKYGARPLKRAIERELEDPLAEEILKGSIVGGGGDVSVSAGDGKLVFAQKAARKRARAKQE